MASKRVPSVPSSAMAVTLLDCGWWLFIEVSWNWVRFYHDHNVSEDVLLAEIDFFHMRTELSVWVKVSITVIPFVNVILHYCFHGKLDWEQDLIVSGMEHTHRGRLCSSRLAFEIGDKYVVWQGNGMEKDGRERNELGAQNLHVVSGSVWTPGLGC